MINSTWRRMPLIAGAVTLVMLAGCANAPATPPASDKPSMETAGGAAPVVTSTPLTYFAVLPEDERHYLFSDHKTYFSYLEHNEVALTRTRIGASPAGTTVVFGITDADIKSAVPSVAEQLFDGKLVPGQEFYGEVFKDGRFYVFSAFADMNAFLAHGEVAYGVTDIGTGPNGASLVWVLNKDTIKGGRPEKTVARFNALRGAR